ncbi:hypothetical protein BJX64DRAFT_124664 [Aspergillus heterothallicus]
MMRYSLLLCCTASRSNPFDPKTPCRFRPYIALSINLDRQLPQAITDPITTNTRIMKQKPKYSADAKHLIDTKSSAHIPIIQIHPPTLPSQSPR